MSAVCPNGHDSASTDYCDVCGTPIPAGAASEPAPQPAPSSVSANSLDLPPAAPAGPKACPNCGTPNADSSLFCEACGYDFTTGALPAGASPVPAAAPEPPAADPGTPEAPDSAVASSVPEPEAEKPSGEPDADPESSSAAHAFGGAELAGPEAGSGHGDQGAELAGSAAGMASPDVAGPTFAGSDSGVPPRIAFQWVAEVWIDPDWYADQQAEEPLPSAGLPVTVPLRVASALIGRASASRQIQPDIDCSADPGVSRRHAQLTTDGSRWFVEDLASSNGTFVGPAFGPLPQDPISVGPKVEVGDNRIYVGAWTRIVVRRATDEEIAIG